MVKRRMSGETGDASQPTEPVATPETTAFLLATFADLYRQEVAAEEDVHRTLPFFGTALGIVVAALLNVASPRYGVRPIATPQTTPNPHSPICPRSEPC